MFNLLKPPPFVVLTLMALALVGAGFAGGRYSVPEFQREEAREKLIYVDRVVASVDTDKILNALKAISEVKDVHTKKKTIKLPDGTVTTETETIDKTKTDTKEQVQVKERVVETRIEEKLVYKDRETIKTIERSRSTWALELMPGFDFAGALGSGPPRYNLLPDSTFLKHAVLGMSIQRRIVGPLSAGLWANSAGMGGLVLRWEF